MKSSYSNFFRCHRGAIMGLSILSVMIFHYGIQMPLLHTISLYGWIGVDMFIFLSAIGLCYSLEKNPCITDYYKRRALRILPTWWTYMVVVVIVSALTSLPHPSTISQIFLYFTGLGYWVSGYYNDFDNAHQVYFNEWFIPTLLVFYLIFPLLQKMNKKVTVVITVAVLFVTNIRLVLGFSHSIDLSYPRLLSFLIGIATYKFLLTETDRRTAALFKSIFIALPIVTFFLYRYSSFVSFRIFVSVSMPLMFYILGRIIDWTKSVKPLSFLGSISLELYLVHLYLKLPSFSIGNLYIDGDWLLIPFIAVNILAAWCFHVSIRYTLSFIKRY